MKQKRQSNVKKQQSTEKKVKKENVKLQTFVWPLGNVKEVYLAGNFNQWKPEPMAKSDAGFLTTVKLDPGVYQYKFIVDGQWLADPSASENTQNEFGTANSVLVIS